MNLQKSTRIIVLIYIMMLIGGLVLAYCSGYNPSSDKAIYQLEGAAFKPSLEPYTLVYSSDEIVAYETQFTKRSDLVDSIELAILVPRLATNGYRIYLNNQLIGQLGSLNQGMSNLWNSVGYFPIMASQLEADNTLRIESVSYYRSGLETDPIYVMNNGDALAYKQWFELFNQYGIILGIGVMFLGVLLLITLYLMSDLYKEVLLWLASAMFFMMIYILDYTHIAYLPIDYFFYKKIIMISFWTSSVCMGISIYKILGNKVAAIVPIISWVGILFISLIATDLVMFKNAYGLWYISQVVNVMVWVIITFKYHHQSLEARVFFFGYLTLFVYGLLNYLFDRMSTFFVMNSPMLYIGTFAIMPLMLVFFDIAHQKNRLLRETGLRKESDRKAYFDALTNVRNMHYLKQMIGELEPPYVVCMFDFDNFKQINDVYGHKAGDDVLKFVADAMHQYLRSNETLIRLGGDEFLTLMPTSLDDAVERMTVFNQFMAHAVIPHYENRLSITLSTGIYKVDHFTSLDDILKKVDKALYASKDKGKNAITLYDELNIILDENQLAFDIEY